MTSSSQALRRDYTHGADHRARAGHARLRRQADEGRDARSRPLDHERLRAAGFDDRGILQITLIASWFNYINRVADALGVGREEV